MSPLPEAAQRAIAQLRRTGGTQLSLTHLGLERFPVEVLELTQLTALKVHGEFTRVPQEITRLSALERLELGGRVGRLPVAMAKMPALRSLTLNGARRWPTGLERLDQLEELRFIYGRFTALPDAFAGLRSLQRLHVLSGHGANKLRALPPSIGALPALRHLDVGYNHELGRLPDSLGGLEQLETLIAPWCGLSELPASLGGLRALQRLELHENALSRWPEALAELPALRSLSLFGNPLAAVPDALGAALARSGRVSLARMPLTRLPRLPAETRELYLRGHQLEALPEWIGELEALETLSVLDGPLTHLPESLGRLRRLRVLDLSRNRLQRLPEGTCRLGALRELRLGFNALEALPEPLGALSQLRVLHLQSNRLRSLPASCRALTQLVSNASASEDPFSDEDWEPGLELRGNALPGSVEGEPQALIARFAEAT